MARASGILAVWLLTSAACASTRLPPAASGPAWPPAPESARVAYVRSVSRPEDLGIRRGVLRTTADVIFGAAPRRLVRPMAVAIGMDGTLFVADPGAGGVHRFDRVRRRYSLLRRREGALPSPVGLAVASDGTLYATDSRLNAVFVLAPGARAFTLLPTGPLSRPTGIALDETRARLYVVETAAHRIAVFGLSGARAGMLGERGDGKGTLNFPTLASVDAGGRLWIADSMNFRILAFEPDGAAGAAFGKVGDGSGDFARPKGIAVDGDGHLWVVDGLHSAVQVFDPEGNLLLRIGERGGGPGEFLLPAGIAVRGSDIAVADALNARVQLFLYRGGEP